MKTHRFYFLLLLLWGTFFLQAQERIWVAPKFSNSIVNPLKGDEKATAKGKELFNQMCVLCHGLKGRGNGEAGLTLQPSPANFFNYDVFTQTDGALFWKITEGKAPMASYEELLTEDERWQLVNYIRNLEKK